MQSNIQILIIEDDDLMQHMIADALGRKGYQTAVSDNGLDGLKQFQEDHYPLVIIDLKLPKLDGISVLKKIKAIAEETIVIMMTAYGTVETAVEAMKHGAYDYITKPFLAEELIFLIEKGLELRKLKEENILLKQELGQRFSAGSIICRSDVMHKILALIEDIAPLNSTVLIHGESGTGKELLTETIHHLSPRKDKPLIKVSCAVLAESLLESELFGYEKGAFTGALKRKVGRFELAYQGSLFLDDIDDMSPKVQVKLLRVLQEKEFERVGGTETIKTDVRLIAATKKDLKQEIESGNFREDLYYRLNVIPIFIPPLRERKEDIPVLITHFLAQYNSGLNREVAITTEVMKVLQAYHWPGNIRELEHLVERLVATCKGHKIYKNDLPGYLHQKKSWQAALLKQVAQEAEKEHIIKTLNAVDFRRKDAAALLGVSTKTLWQKIKEYGIE